MKLNKTAIIWLVAVVFAGFLVFKQYFQQPLEQAEEASVSEEGLGSELFGEVQEASDQIPDSNPLDAKTNPFSEAETNPFKTNVNPF